MKKYVGIALVVIMLLMCYPFLEISINNKLYVFNYFSDYTEWEENTCYDDSFSYNEKRDISISDIKLKNILFFKWFEIIYTEGNMCEEEYVIEEKRFLDIVNKGIIINNDDKVDILSLIKNKQIMKENKKYNWLDDYKYISYKYNSEVVEIYVTERENNTIIFQIGNSDENPKFIAYK